MAITQPIKWHGGKHYLAKWIIELMPPRCKTPNAPKPGDDGWLHYVEPFFGGGAVLFRQDPEGISEVVNDINESLFCFWQVMGSERYFKQFRQIINNIPFSSDEWDNARANDRDDFGSLAERAANFFIRYRQSRQGLGKDFATLSRRRTRRGMNEQVAAWLTAVEGLHDAHTRLKRVVVLNRPAVEVIKQQDGPQTLFYLDPPYLHETRHGDGVNSEYEHEMTYEDHKELLCTLDDVQGRFLLSGYPSELYRDLGHCFGWNRVDIEIDNKASSKATKEKKIECVWMNY